MIWPFLFFFNSYLRTAFLLNAITVCFYSILRPSDVDIVVHRHWIRVKGLTDFHMYLGSSSVHDLQSLCQSLPVPI